MLNSTKLVDDAILEAKGAMADKLAILMQDQMDRELMDLLAALCPACVKLILSWRDEGSESQQAIAKRVEQIHAFLHPVESRR